MTRHVLHGRRSTALLLVDEDCLGVTTGGNDPIARVAKTQHLAANDVEEQCAEMRFIG